MGIEIAIEEWGPAVKTRIAKIRSQLNSADENHNKILDVINQLDETYLKDGY